jgi:hypothetical protein
MALLGELHYIPNTDSSWTNLPRAGGIAYAAQESWVLNDTIRNNIIFTSDFDPTRYAKGGAFSVKYLCKKSIDEGYSVASVCSRPGLESIQSW